MVSLLAETSEKKARSKPAEMELNLDPLPSETGHSLAGLFKLLSDETRLRIVYFLMQKKELNVRTFCRLLDQSQPAVSHHLAMLKEAGVLDSRREGKHNFYRLMPKRVQSFVDLLFGGAPDEPRQFRLDDCILTYSREKE